MTPANQLYIVFVAKKRFISRRFSLKLYKPQVISTKEKETKWTPEYTHIFVFIHSWDLSWGQTCDTSLSSQNEVTLTGFSDWVFL